MIESGFLPDYIESSSGLSLAKQQRVLKKEAKYQLRRLRSKTNGHGWPWACRDDYGYDRVIKAATKHWAWMEIRLRKRAYDRMNEEEKALRKDKLSREIDWLLKLHETGVWSGDRPFGEPA